MSNARSGGPEVFRGMHLEPAALRLCARPRVPAVEAVQAEAQAADELQLARERTMREGREQGLRSGHAEGLQQGRAAAAEEVGKEKEAAIAKALAPLRAEHDMLRQLADSIRGAKDDAIAAAHDDMLALCFETICRIVGRTALQPEMVEAQLAELLRLHHGSHSAVLHVHPQDAELLSSRVHDASHDLRWTADPQVKLGGCIVRSKAGGLDARLETMLASCKATLLESRARATEPRSARGQTP
jgi:flagellar assembly protein FliH